MALQPLSEPLPVRTLLVLLLHARRRRVNPPGGGGRSLSTTNLTKGCENKRSHSLANFLLTALRAPFGSAARASGRRWLTSDSGWVEKKLWKEGIHDT